MTAGIGAKLNNSSVSSWKALKTLTVMQLREKMDFSFVRSFQKSLFKTIYFLLEFIIVTLICYFLIKFSIVFGVFSISKKTLPASVIGIIFTFMLILSIISATWTLVKSLYLSRDNLVLLTFPASSSVVFLSKIAVYFIYEIRKNFMFLLPLFVAYGINHSFAFYYYFWLLFLFLLISLLPILIAALLSIPTLFVYQFLRKAKALQYVLTAVLLCAVGLGVFKLISLIPADIDFNRDWEIISDKIFAMLVWFVRNFPLMNTFTHLVIGKSIGVGLSGIKIFHDDTFLTLIGLIGTVIISLTLCFLLAKPLFYKMASKPFEFNKKIVKTTHKNRKYKPFLSSLKKEFVVSLKSGSLLSLVAVLVVIQPLAIELLNRLYAAMNTRFLGMQMTIAFNMFIMLLINLSSNISIASVYSRDGATSYLNKVQPSAYVPILLSKLIINLLVGLIGIIITLFTFAPFYSKSMTSVSVILFGVVLYGAFASHMFWSAEMDIMKPQTEQYATFSEQANNPNENMSAILCFTLSALISGISLLLALENPIEVWVKLSALMVAFLAFRILNYALKIRAFYREK